MTLGMPALVAAAASSHSIGILTDLVIVLAACVVFGLAARLLGQSVLVGYLLAGVVIGGPSSLELIDDVGSFSFMGEVGVALLLFAVGLDLPIHKVRKFGSMAAIAGGLQFVGTTAATFVVARAFDLGSSESFIVAVAVSLSSTAVVLSVLDDRSERDSVHGLVTTGMLIAQDIIVVLVLLSIPLLPGAESGADQSGFLTEFGVALGKLAGIVVAMVLLERVLMRRAFTSHRLTGTRELLAVASLTISLGAIGACWALDLSPALGGFIAGVVMADASYSAQVRSEIAPIRMGLLAVFFAYVGMLADAEWMLHHVPLVLAALLPLMVGKALLAWAAARIARVGNSPAVMTGASLAQLGEFSFAVLTAGIAAGLVGGDTFRTLVAVSLLSLLVTPWVMAGASRFVQRTNLRAGEDMALDDEPVEQAVSGHAIVVGVGPSGRAVTTALAGAGVMVTVIELNPRIDAEAERDEEGDPLPSGTRIVFGDAARPEILHRANLATARILVVAIPDPTSIQTIVAQASHLAPDVPIVARGRYHRYVDDIEAAGAAEVVDEEHVTGRELATVALRRLVLERDADG